MQACKLKKPKLFWDKLQGDLAIIVAHLHKTRKEMARHIVRWERSWVENRVIPEIQAGKNKYTFF